MSAHARWQRLSKRERLALLSGAALLGILALWRLAWLPVVGRTEAAWAARAEQLAMARQLADAPAQRLGARRFTAEQLHASLIEAGVVVQRMDIAGDRAQLTLEGAPAVLWPWLEQVDRSALAIETVTLAKEHDRLRLALAVSGLALAD